MLRHAAILLLTLCPAQAKVQEFFTLKGHGGPIMGIATAADGRIATASFDNAVGLWDGRSPQWLDGHEAAVNTVLFSEGILYSAGDDFSVRRWPEGTPLGRHKGKVVDLCAVPGGIATASWDGSIGIWPRTGGTARMLTGHAAGVNAVVYSRTRDRLYSAGADGTIRVWDLTSGTQERQLLRHGFGINELILDPQEHWLAYGAVDGGTRIIELETGDTLADLTLERRPVLALALSPLGDQLAVGDGEGYIMIVDTQDWRITHDFRATLKGPIWALAFSGDGQNIHAGGLDDTLYSWPVATLDRHGQMNVGDRSFLRDPMSMSNGERQFARKCSICHSLDPGSARRAGPTLYQVFGRSAGAVADYQYSETLAESDIIWTEDSINALFDLGPDHYIPGSKMPMQRITDPKDRDDLIAYLRQATSKEPSE
ncbi:c-type cytochrome [Rhodobacteraceae bacterium F11138]|nr:c-type cytochrome [Rhodobacteraceae bacterium F11138]